MRSLTTADIELLCKALGLKDGLIAPYRSTYISSDATLEPCQALQARGYLREIGVHEASTLFEVTDLGRDLAREYLLGLKVNEVVQGMVDEEAEIAAAEAVGRGGYVYDRLREKLKDDPKLIAGVKSRLLGETFRVASDLRDALGFARGFLPESGPRRHIEAVSFVDATLEKADALVGRGSLALASMRSNRQAEPSSMVHRCFAVFEFYPPQPVDWSDARGAYVAERDTPTRFVRCEALPDGRLAVLKTKLGAALRGSAQSLAEEIGGVVIQVDARRWPTSDECFVALRAHLESQDAQESFTNSAFSGPETPQP